MKFTPAPTTTIFILFSAAATPSTFADVVEGNIIPVSDEQGPHHDPVSHVDVDLGTQKFRGDGEESNKNVAPDLLGAVQIGFANCNTKTQCTKYGKNSCEQIYADCNKQCVWNSSKEICAYNIGPSPRGPTHKPTKKPTKRPSPTPGSSICTRSLDYSCYKTGRPECCSYNDGQNCPSYNTMCNNYPEGLMGWNYCTYQPDYNCYPDGGRPSCCLMSGGGTMNCPVNQPSCVNSGPTHKPTKRPSPTPGSSICTRSPDYSCYKTGHPECCSYNGGRNCPSYDTMCNNYPEGLTGWNYCTYQPDFGCYPNGGRPSCCLMSGGGTMNCPVNQPSCENSRFLRGNRIENN